MQLAPLLPLLRGAVDFSYKEPNPKEFACSLDDKDKRKSLINHHIWCFVIKQDYIFSTLLSFIVMSHDPRAPLWTETLSHGG